MPEEVAKPGVEESKAVEEKVEGMVVDEPTSFFLCTVCGKKFGTEHGLKVHTARMHPGEPLDVNIQ